MALPGPFRGALLLGVAFLPVSAQVCRLSIAGVNRNRQVEGQIHAECPDTPIHTSPFGNWGVTSNYGSKRNAHQFDGWCHDTRICDNGGSCRTVCQDGWYEWNSCTDHTLYSAPNPTLYNAGGGTSQVTSTGVNVLGTLTVDIPVRCPVDTDGNGTADAGGCADARSYSPGTNFMTLYELDPVCCDDLVQTVYFPSTTVSLTCDVWGCAPGGSDWVGATGWDSPTSPPKVFAELATVVNWGSFVNTNNACRFTSGLLTAVSAASLTGPALAPDSIGTVFGDALAFSEEQATSVPLPTSLGGIGLRMTDSGGGNALAPLFYAGPKQVNFLVPRALKPGPITLELLRGGGVTASGRAQLDPVAPALFTASQNGRGVASANSIHVSGGGSVTSGNIFQCTAPGSCTAVPIDLGSPGDRTYLVLYGTGIRGNTDPTMVTVTIGGQRAEVLYAGAQPEYAGLDQVNVLVPDSLRGGGEVDILLNVTGKPANAVRATFR